MLVRLGGSGYQLPGYLPSRNIVCPATYYVPGLTPVLSVSHFTTGDAHLAPQTFYKHS